MPLSTIAILAALVSGAVGAREHLKERRIQRVLMFLYYARSFMTFVLPVLIMVFALPWQSAKFDWSETPERPEYSFYTASKQDTVVTDATGTVPTAQLERVADYVGYIGTRCHVEPYFYFTDKPVENLSTLYDTLCFDQRHLLIVGMMEDTGCTALLYPGDAIRYLFPEARIAGLEEALYLNASVANSADGYARTLAGRADTALSSIFEEGRQGGNTVILLIIVLAALAAGAISYLGLTLYLKACGLPRKRKDARALFQSLNEDPNKIIRFPS